MSKRRFATNIWLYLTNGAKYGHSYYGTLIGTRICVVSIGAIFSDLE